VAHSKLPICPVSGFCYVPVVPAVKLTTIGNWAFPVSGHRTWNQLPKDIALSIIVLNLLAPTKRFSLPEIISER